MKFTKPAAGQVDYKRQSKKGKILIAEEAIIKLAKGQQIKNVKKATSLKF